MSTVYSHPPETNAGTTTSWLPMSTAWVSIPGCESSFWKVNPTILAGWDPGYGVYVQPGLSCHPPQVTSWWDENHMNNINTINTQFSLGPVTCPQAYTTASTTVNADSSTFVGCCPSGYSFVDFNGAGDTGECISQVTPGQVVQFATYISSSWTISTSTVQTSSGAYGIQVNGWLFPSSPTGATSTTVTASTQTSQTSTNTADNGGSSGLSTGAKVGIGVGVPLGVIALAALSMAYFFYRRARRMQDTVTTPEPGKPAIYTPQQQAPVYYNPSGGAYVVPTVPPPQPLSELPESHRVELPVQYPA